MHRRDDDYKWGIFVQQNMNPIKKANGSCIFLHIWESEEEGTAGCTAMEEKNMVRILRWIRTKKHPVLAQFPRDVYKSIRTTFSLPDL
jgi:D-alanyl-D-alanine dipeptidase